MDDNWPAGKLIVRVGERCIDCKFKTIEFVCFGFNVDCNQPKPAGFLVCFCVSIFVDTCFGISYRIDVDFVATAIEILSGVVLIMVWTIPVRHADFIG